MGSGLLQMLFHRFFNIMDITDIDGLYLEDITCMECGLVPDFVYFNTRSGEILAIICEDCRDAFNSVVRSMGAEHLH